MTVKELITVLKEMPEDLDVFIYDVDNDEYDSVCNPTIKELVKITYKGKENCAPTYFGAEDLCRSKEVEKIKGVYIK